MLPRDRGEVGAAWKDGDHSGAHLEHERRVGLGREPEHGALRQQGQPLGPSGERAAAAAVTLGEGLERPVAENQARAGHSRQRAADDVARGAATASDDHGHGRAHGERLLERSLVVVHGEAAGDGEAGLGQRVRQRGDVVLVGAERDPDRDDERAHGHDRTARLAPRITSA
jgi:hypothetical protein